MGKDHSGVKSSWLEVGMELMVTEMNQDNGDDDDYLVITIIIIR